MPVGPDQFNTVSDELLEAVVALANARSGAGYKITIEPTEIYYPATPALKLYRRPETVIVEIGGKRLPKRLLDHWVSYAVSCSTDTRICYCTNERISEASEHWLRQRRIGWIKFNDGAIIEQIAPHDLALPLNLPPLDTLKAPVRAKLVRAYEKHETGDWRGGFEEACKSFERECRKYLLKPHVQQRVRIQTKANKPPARIDPKEVRKMPLGALGGQFGKIIGPNQIDSRIWKVIKSINPDRINVAHGKKEGEAKLRRNVGRNILAIVGCMNEM